MLRTWRRRRLLKTASLPDALWQAWLPQVPTAARLSPPDQDRLRELVVLFLHEKQFEGARQLPVTESMKALVAIQACVPILNLGFEAYDGWWSVIMYPEAFVVAESHVDEAGVVYDTAEPADGESWERGPLVLSWQDACADLEHLDGSNVIIHECAHKLDLLDGEANGVPSLPGNIDAGAWQRDFGRAFERFCQDVKRGRDTLLDPYAAECPAEFFAVSSEAFFEIPELLAENLPEVHGHLRAYYRQDPAASGARAPGA
jgi:Mlc titration factor MtfA (ptsG expression regulator)